MALTQPTDADIVQTDNGNDKAVTATQHKTQMPNWQWYTTNIKSTGRSTTTPDQTGTNWTQTQNNELTKLDLSLMSYRQWHDHNPVSQSPPGPLLPDNNLLWTISSHSNNQRTSQAMSEWVILFSLAADNIWDTWNETDSHTSETKLQNNHAVYLNITLLKLSGQHRNNDHVQAGN